MTRIRWITLGVAVFVIAFGTLLVVTVGRPAGNSHGDMVDRPAPALTFTSVATNKPITTASLRGKAVIVNFWNTWCIPCRQEQPALQAFYTTHRNDPDFTMLGVVRSDTETAVRTYAAREQLNWNLVMDPGGEAAVAYGTTGQPETYAIAPNGVVAGQLIGPASVNDLERMLAAARGES